MQSMTSSPLQDPMPSAQLRPLAAVPPPPPLLADNYEPPMKKTLASAASGSAAAAAVAAAVASGSMLSASAAATAGSSASYNSVIGKIGGGIMMPSVTVGGAGGAGVEPAGGGGGVVGGGGSGGDYDANGSICFGQLALSHPLQAQISLLPMNLKVHPPVRSQSASSSASSTAGGGGRAGSVDMGGVGGGVDDGTDTTTSIAVRLREAFEVADAGSSLVLQDTTRSLAQFYSSLALAEKSCFIRTLATEYGVDHRTVENLAGRIAPALARAGKSDTQLYRIEDRLRQVLQPRYHQLFVQLGRLEHGIAFLVNFRADLIIILRSPGVDQDSCALQTMNSTLLNLLSLWLSPGSLKFERITWTSPCDLLQKISAYEAVQPIRNWSDLRRRVGPYRRCFAFTHACLPREPLVVVHTALAPQISRSMQAITGDKSAGGVGGAFSDSSDLDTDAAGREDAKVVNAAIFYSITSTQKGLQGVELGNNLIKRIITELVTEFPHLAQFSSLSPIPGFRDWLLEEINKFIRLQQMGEHPEQRLLSDAEIADISSVFGSFESTVFELLREVLRTDAWVDQPHLTQILSGPLLRLCARYLYVEKKHGYAINPVANFHLRNGAVLWRLNWMSDTSSRGLSGSCSIMANYRYYPEQTEENMRQYVQRQIIPASGQIYDLVGEAPNHIVTSRNIR